MQCSLFSVVLAVMLVFSHVTLAAEATEVPKAPEPDKSGDSPINPTPAAETPKAPEQDKSGYSLINPTPRDLMRDMDTDRPDKTNTPRTVDAGHFQLETGVFNYNFTRDTSGPNDVSTTTMTLGQFNLRVGLLNNLEFNAAVNSYLFQKSVDHVALQTSHQCGNGDTVLGGKFNFFGNDGEDHPLKIALGIQPQFKLPTAQRDLGNNHFEFTVGIPFALALPDDFQLGLQTTPGQERNSANTGYVTGWQNSVTLHHPLVVKNLDSYIEFWSQAGTEKHRLTQSTFDTGVIYQLNSNMTLDTGVNLGLNRQTTKVECFLGISVRF